MGADGLLQSDSVRHIPEDAGISPHIYKEHDLSTLEIYGIQQIEKHIYT